MVISKHIVVVSVFYLATSWLQQVDCDQEQPKHWSALENYYKKLKIAPQPPSNDDNIYQIVLQQEPDGYPVYDTKLTQIPQYSRIESRFPQVPATNNFLLPIEPATRPPVTQRPLTYNVPSSGESFNRYDLPYRLGISRKEPEIGAASILMNNKSPHVEQQTIPIIVRPTLTNSRPPVLDYDRKTDQPPITMTYQVVPKDHVWRYMPEQIRIQQQQNRLKHQLETLGAGNFDQQRLREQVLEEFYCGRRNYLGPLSYKSNPILGKIQSKTSPLNTVSYSKLQQQLVEQVEPAQEAFNEYPSHMGIYNGSKPDHDNYLCAATLIHEEFALTLASCFRNVVDPSKLIIRAGEWNVDKNATIDRPMEIREIAQIHYFRNDSYEHNLALIKFTKPIDSWWDRSYISPACQMHTRTTLRASSCWVPARNISYVQYFDPEGEGETKERKIINMIEEPVKLVANDDAECQQTTRVELFNYRHPNYICAADTPRWKARLNTTEHFGSGIYCNEGGYLSLVSILHPILSNTSSAFGYIDLSYYKPWMRSVIFGRL